MANKQIKGPNLTVMEPERILYPKVIPTSPSPEKLGLKTGLARANLNRSLLHTTTKPLPGLQFSKSGLPDSSGFFKDVTYDGKAKAA